MEGLWNFSLKKTVECSKFSEFCGSLEDLNVERNVEDEGLDYEVLEGSKDKRQC